MSIALLSETIADLPFAIREQVISYAESVQAAAPNIAHDAGVECRQDFSDKLVYLSGIRKLYSLVSSAYWSLDNTTTILTRSEINAITIAGQSFSRNSIIFDQIQALLSDLDATLVGLDIKATMQMSYKDLAEWIDHGSE